MIAIIPMAGKGERFVKAGYTIPKPLLTINTIPMVVKAALDLPKADEYIFIALQFPIFFLIVKKLIVWFLSLFSTQR